VLTLERITAQPTFAGLSPDARDAIAERAQELSYPTGAEVCGRDDNAYHLYVIEEGTVEVHGTAGLLAELGPGDFFGEVGLFVTGRRTASVVATSPLRVITLFDRDVREIRDALPEVDEQLRAALADRFVR
jgi:voltage-gated potassium channel